MKKIFLVSLITFSLLMAAGAVDPVRELKAYDAGFKKTPISSNWQNFSDKVLLEWKEPFSDNGVKAYKYYFGQNANGAMNKTTTQINLITPKLEKPGIYYFRIAAISTDDTVSEVRAVTIKYDNTPVKNLLTVKSYANADKKESLTEATIIPATILPFFVLDLNKLKFDSAPVKGVNVYWGTDSNGEPDRQVNKEFAVIKNPLGGQTYYLRANVEDEAGNVSETKTLFSVKYSSVAEASQKPNVVILSKTKEIADSPEGEVLPGSVIKYTIKLNNQGQGPANSVELKDAIPDNTVYVNGSATSTKPASIEFWNPELNGGRGAWTTTADALKITRIRWVFTESFEPVTDAAKAEATLAYSVLVAI